MIIESVINHADVHVLNELVEDVDLIMDATDNFDTRMMINDVAYKNQIHGFMVELCGVHMLRRLLFLDKRLVFNV